MPWIYIFDCLPLILIILLIPLHRFSLQEQGSLWSFSEVNAHASPPPCYLRGSLQSESIYHHLLPFHSFTRHSALSLTVRLSKSERNIIPKYHLFAICLCWAGCRRLTWLLTWHTCRWVCRVFRFSCFTQGSFEVHLRKEFWSLQYYHVFKVSRNVESFTKLSV